MTITGYHAVLSRCPVVNDEAGETQSQTLVFEGSRLKWMPCMGSGELAIISGIIEENLLHRNASDFDPSSLSFICLRTVGGTEMQLRSAISNSRKVSSIMSTDRCFRVTGIVSPSE